MKSASRTALAFAAGVGLTLLLVWVVREAPPPPPPAPSGPAPATRPQDPPSRALRSTPRSPAPRPAPPRVAPAVVEPASPAVTVPSSEPVQPVPTDPPATLDPMLVAGWRFVARPGSKVRIEGTSNVHDWQVEGNIIGGRAEFGAGFPLNADEARPGPVEADVQATIPVRSLKSVTLDGAPFNAKMDDIMYGLLLEATSKSIQFTLKELTLTSVPAVAGEPFAFDSRGELMVAGVTNTLNLPVHMTVLPDARLRFSGSVSVKMTDFGIQPPRPLNLGITTGDDVRLSFEWVVGWRPPESAGP